jgi:hypothetical protein
VLKKIKKIIISTVLLVPVLGYAASHDVLPHPNFQHMNFDKDTFSCEACTERNCMDAPRAGHCVAWCNNGAYKACWEGALKARDIPNSDFLKLYAKLSPHSQTQLIHLLHAAKNNTVLNAFEEHVKTNELLKELQNLHREQQKEKSSAVAGFMQIVP